MPCLLKCCNNRSILQLGMYCLPNAQKRPRVSEVWREARALDTPEFEPLTTITRCIHFNRAVTSFHHKMLEPVHMNKNIQELKAKVLWFTASKSVDEHNMFGNVSFTISWKTVVAEFGMYLYYIDCLHTSQTIYTRVLLTNKFRRELEDVEQGGPKMPFWKRGNSDFASVTSGSKKHVLEIAIEADEATGKWLYAHSKIEANNHCHANTPKAPGVPYTPYVCHAYNREGKPCPSAHSRLVTKEKMQKRCPGMLEAATMADMTQVEVYTGSYSDNDDSDDDSNAISKISSLSLGRTYCGSPPRSSYTAASYGGGASFSSTRKGYGGGSSFSSSREGYGGGPRPSWSQQKEKQAEDEEWSTGEKVALGAAAVVGGLALFAGLAAAFGGGEDANRGRGQGGRGRGNGT